MKQEVMMKQLTIFEDKEELTTCEYWRALCEEWYGRTYIDSEPEQLPHNYRGRQKIVKLFIDRYGKEHVLKHYDRIKTMLTNIEIQICLRYHGKVPHRLH